MRIEDAAPLHAIFSDPVAMQYFSDVHTDFETTRAWVRGTVNAPPDQTCEYVLLRNGVVIGKAGIWQKPELGFLLRRDMWRQGLMREALDLLVPHLAQDLAIPAITADVDPRNIASLSVLRGLGFAQTHSATATIRIGGVWCDSLFLEWRAP